MNVSELYPASPETKEAPVAKKSSAKKGGKSKKPAAPPKETKERAKPMTLRARVRLLGPHHEAAYDVLSKPDGKFADSVRAALDFDATLALSEQNVVTAKAVLLAATEKNAALKTKQEASKAVLVRLQETADFIKRQCFPEPKGE